MPVPVRNDTRTPGSTVCSATLTLRLRRSGEAASTYTRSHVQAHGICGNAIEAATASRELAEEQLQAEESKFEVGLSTNFFVLQSQRDLATAQDAELRAILDYQRARIEFERTQRASLGAAGIALVGGAMAGEPVGFAGAAPSGPLLTPQR